MIVVLLIGLLVGWVACFAWVWVRAARSAIRGDQRNSTIDYDALIPVGMFGFAWPAALVVFVVVLLAKCADAALRRALAPKPPAPKLPDAETYRNGPA